MARDVTSYHSHSDVLMFLVEMDPSRCMVARDTKKFKNDICYDIHIVYKPSKFPILYKKFLTITTQFTLQFLKPPPMLGRSHCKIKCSFGFFKGFINKKNDEKVNIVV